jgi:hypothetical protein
MLPWEMPSRHLRTLSHAALITLLGVGIAVLAYEAPLTYDEAYNRLVYGQRGVLDILGTYDAPNNHLIFTVLQSLIPSGMLTWDPWTIRIFGVASGIAIVAALVIVAIARRTTPLLGVLLVVGSPLLVTYLFVSRGYTFSAVFLVAAALLPAILGPRGVPIAAAALALGTWPLPTNAFVAPGWVVVVLAAWGLRVALVGAAVYAAAVAAMLGPIAGQIWRQGRLWNAHEHWWPWVGDLFNATSLVPECAVLVAVVAAFALRRRPAPAPALALGMAASWFLLVALTHAAGINLPFVRTAVPALWLAVVGIVAAFPRGRLEYLALALLAPAFVLGVVMWSNAIRDGDWQSVSRHSRNDVLYGTTPATIRSLSSIGADRITCANYDTWVCELVAPSLGGIAVDVPSSFVPYDESLRCAVGSRRPPDPFQVTVYRAGRELGVLCH